MPPLPPPQWSPNERACECVSEQASERVFVCVCVFVCACVRESLFPSQVWGVKSEVICELVLWLLETEWRGKELGMEMERSETLFHR